MMPDPSGPGTAGGGVPQWAAQSSASFRDQETDLGTDHLCFSLLPKAKAKLPDVGESKLQTSLL